MTTPSRSTPLRVLRLSEISARRLEAAPPDLGHIHSIFKRAVNLLCSDGRFFTLHDPGPLAAPFAAALDRGLPRGALRPGMPVRRDDGRLLAGGLAIDWSMAHRCDTSITPTDEGGRSLRLALFDAGLAPGSRALGSSAGSAARRRLSESIRERDAEGFVAGARGLIGLGEGLTPAGDDCVVGALAVLHRLCRPFLVEHPAIKSELARTSREATTDVGREFVLHALDGAFSEPVITLVTAGSQPEARHAADVLLTMGATSGADTMAGMRLALLGLEA